MNSSLKKAGCNPSPSNAIPLQTEAMVTQSVSITAHVIATEITSARRYEMVRTDIGTRNEGAYCDIVDCCESPSFDSR
ncbi:hypothetical protein TNCV_3913011 [Trichonephila clavipes]|nr:hypothetical protein TNCV_3913011 [Trichonephila clavipes]